MNLNGDEKRIQQLFRDMSRDDRRRAPQFAGVIAAAQSHRSRDHHRAWLLRFGIAAAMVCVVMLIVALVVMKPSNPIDEQVSVKTQPDAPPSITESQPVEGTDVTNKTNRRRHRRTSGSLAAAMKSLSAWQSPTASLLQTPVDESLRSLPRLGESLETIKRFSPDQFN